MDGKPQKRMAMKILIVGGGSDVGKAVWKLFDEEPLFPTKEELDITDELKVKRYISLHKPDIVINCAGYIKQDPIFVSNTAEWISQIDVNLIGSYLVSKYSIQNGVKKIIHIASTSGLKGRKNWSAYCASKAGLISLVESLVEEGIDAYCIIPGRIDTKMRSRLFPNEEKSNLLEPYDVARLVQDVINGVIIERFVIIRKEYDGIKVQNRENIY